MPALAVPQTDMRTTSPHVTSEDLATCVSCGLCLNDCPTYRVLGEEADSPRGRIQLIRDLVSTDAPPEARLVEHLDACLVCRACETVCPSAVPFGRIMEGAREVVAERRPKRGLGAFAMRAGLGVVSRPLRLGLVTALAGLYLRTGLQRLAQRVLPARLAAMQRLLARPEGPAFAPVERADGDLALFAGCVMRTGFGDTHRSTVRVLERSGHRVTSPRAQACCGALHAHAGDGEGSRELARANIAAFGEGDLPIVVNAAGCGAHLKGYAALLHGDAGWSERAERFSARVRDASEVAAPEPPTRAPSREVRVAYQDACHLAHGQQIRRQPRALLAAIPNVRVVPLVDAERCCGSAGVYNLTHPEIAGELQRQKVAAILAALPDVVVSANPGCMLQLRAGLDAAGSRLPVVHLMRFLDDPSACLSAR